MSLESECIVVVVLYSAFVVPWTVVPGIFQARILGWSAIACSSRLSRLQYQTRISYIGSWILYP